VPTKPRLKIWISPKASPELKKFKPALRKLGDVHEDYMQADGWQDYSFWYGERTHIGFLAAAVWLTRGTALEEYGTKKSRGKKHGRCDLFVRTKRGDPGFECESKRAWIDLAKRTETCLRELERTLDLAFDDVTRVYSGKGLGLCFAAIENSKVLPEQVLQKRLDALISEIERKRMCDALVWIPKPSIRSMTVRKFKRQVGLLLTIREKR